jgi:hypothetical protein
LATTFFVHETRRLIVIVCTGWPSGRMTRPAMVTLPFELVIFVTSMRRNSLSRSDFSLPILAW